MLATTNELPTNLSPVWIGLKLAQIGVSFFFRNLVAQDFL